MEFDSFNNKIWNLIDRNQEYAELQHFLPGYHPPFEEDEYYIWRGPKNSFVFNHHMDVVFMTPLYFYDLDSGGYTGCSNLPRTKRAFVSKATYKEVNLKYGLIDPFGNMITDFIFEEYGEEWIVERYIAVKKNGKFGYIDFKGNQLTEFIFDYGNIDREWEKHPNYDIAEIQIKERKSNSEPIITRKGVFAWTGELILQPKYKHITIFEWYREFRELDMNKPEDIELSKMYDKIYLVDFEDRRFVWTHYDGLQEIKWARIKTTYFSDSYCKF